MILNSSHGTKQTRNGNGVKQNLLKVKLDISKYPFARNKNKAKNDLL